ncbi:MAG: T9SS type A sorting domain-containing protein [Ignavibacteria bacterium]|nr:T9SS type A sorting domain-containing protein [Ignavibacteria bacterium]
MKKQILTLILFLLSYFPLTSQTIDSRGKDFWLTFLPNYHNYKYHSNQLFSLSDSIYIFIAAEKPTNGNIEFYDLFGNPRNVSFTINDPNQIYIFKVPFNNYELLGYNDMATEWRQNMDEIPVRLSFHITADNYINVYAHSQGNKSSDAFMVLPTQSLGTEYIVLTYKSDGYFNSPLGRTPSQFAIVAIEDSTIVNIKPSTKTFANADLNQVVTLNKGQVYLVQAEITESNLLADLTGTIVTSNKPIALFAGHQRATIPVEDFIGAASPSRDFLCEQIPPIQAWGKSAFIIPFPQPTQITSRGTDIYRVLAANNNTNVYFNGAIIATLNKGEYYEGRITTAGTITATGPILVAQYKKTSNDGGASYISDPFMMIIPPQEQFIENCKLINIQAYEIQENLQFTKVYQEHYITLVVPQDALTDTKIDGAVVSPGLYKQIPNSNYYYANVRVNEGQHNITSSKPVGVYAYGYGPANSYGYIGGMYFQGRDWNPPKLIIDSTYCFKTILKFSETDNLDTWIDTLYLTEKSKNVKMTVDPKDWKKKKEAKIEIELIDPYQDGNFEVVVADSSGNTNSLSREIYGFTLRHPSGTANKYHFISVNISQGVPLNIPIPIFNYGKGNVKISSINIITNYNFRHTEKLPKTIPSGVNDTLRFVLGEFPIKVDTVFIRIGNECIEAAYVAIVFYRTDCDFSEFDFPTFENPTKLIFVGSAAKVGKWIQLTPPMVNNSGAIWYSDPIPVISGFRTEFSFRVRNGSNNTCKDISIPGADGIAFVIQNYIPYALGTYGGGIGYDGIPNSVAVEFDMFSNDSTQIENFFDPNGNHVAVQSGGQKSNSSKHQPQFTLGINSKILPILTDGTIYYSKIVYYEKNKRLEVYLDTTKEFSTPVLVLQDFDLYSKIKLERGYRAYLGFTSATGCAFESHELLSWYVCPTPPDPLRPVYEENDYQNLAYPIPVEDFVYIRTNEYPISVRIINIFGETIFEQNNIYDNKIDLQTIPNGVYFLEVERNKTKNIEKIIKILR